MGNEDLIIPDFVQKYLDTPDGKARVEQMLKQEAIASPIPTPNFGSPAPTRNFVEPPGLGATGPLTTTSTPTTTKTYTTGYITGTGAAVCDLSKMKSDFKQMDNVVNKLKLANKDTLEGLAHLTQQAQRVEQALNAVSKGIQDNLNAAEAIQEKLKKPVPAAPVPTPDQIKDAAMKGGWKPKKDIFE
ncbi:hypothetical protein KCU81_g6271, partial [Aureobasidium melanogenum]|uniref:Uncharacterized protein n=1 Tax=Aureobasidium melanogenum (strain CBS 110374) TaxID=1043003 RepID=A0A074VJI8_AURM1